MTKTLHELTQPHLKPAVAITILDGQQHRGHLISLGLQIDTLAAQASAPAYESMPITLQPAGESTPSQLDWKSIKAIHFIKDLEIDQEESVRFFDSAAIPPYLWVRIAFTDGEVIEGKIDNSLSLMNGPCLLLYPLDEEANQSCVCISRAAIASLQVITFRR
jgi:hypothetical protein